MVMFFGLMVASSTYWKPILNIRPRRMSSSDLPLVPSVATWFIALTTPMYSEYDGNSFMPM